MAEFEVTGVRWQMGEGLTMDERTQKATDFIRTLEVGTALILAAEPDNPRDHEAIAVYMGYTRRVGYIKRECCKEVKPLLDSDRLCRATVSGNDGHVTFYVEIADAPEVNVSPVEKRRTLPECPLPQGIGLFYSDEERALQVVASLLMKLDVSADTADTFLEMVESYMPLSGLSFCFEDDFWRDHVLKKLRKACRLKLTQPVKERLEQLRDKLHQTVGDFHVSHVCWQQQMFDQQLELLRKQAEGEEGLFAKFEKYSKNKSDIIKSLVGWFNKMPHVDLINYKEHGDFARQLSYIGVSRQELYEVYAAILLLDKYGAERTIHNSKPKTTKPKTKAEKKTSDKPMTLKYFTPGHKGESRRQHIRVHQVYNMWRRWGWIDEQTDRADFDAFFEGEPRHCNITWTGRNTAILTILLQELLKQSYIEKQTRCAAKSLVKQQFRKSPSSDGDRLDKVDKDRISYTLFVLDPDNHDLLFKSADDLSQVKDVPDARLEELFAGNLRLTKGI